MVALKPSQVALNAIQHHSHHHSSSTSHLAPVISRKSAPQPPEDNYLRDLPNKPYSLRNSSATGIANGYEKDRDKDKDLSTTNDSDSLFHKNKKSTTTNKWAREDEIKPIIVRPIDYDAKFNHILQSEQNSYPYTPQEQERSVQRDKSPIKKKPISTTTTTSAINNNNFINKSTTNLLKKKNAQNIVETQQMHNDEMPHSSYFIKNKSKLHKNSDLMSSEEALPVNSKGGKNYDMNNHHVMQYLNGKLGTGGSANDSGNGSGNGINLANKKYGAKQRYADPADLPFESPATTMHNNTTAINNNNINIGRNKYAAIHKTPPNYMAERDEEISINDFEINHNSMKNKARIHESTTTKAAASSVASQLPLTKPTILQSINSNTPSPSIIESSNYGPHSPPYPQHYPYHHSSFESIGGRGLHHSKEHASHDNYLSHQQERHHPHHSQERNPYREAESLPYIESMEKMMKSSALRFRPLQNDLMMPPNSPSINNNRDGKLSRNSSKSYDKNELGSGGYEFTYNYGNSKTIDNNRHLPLTATTSSNILSPSNRSLTPLKDYSDESRYLLTGGAN